jgi:hypothetical protein
MKAEELFTSVLLSYKRQLSISGATTSHSGLRDFCRSHHVSYRAFFRWASTQEMASGLVEIERSRKRLQGACVVGVEENGSKPSCPSETGGEPLLYPLHIIPDTEDPRAASVASTPPNRDLLLAGDQVRESILHGVRITFPGGVKISVKEAESRGIYCLIHGKGS